MRVRPKWQLQSSAPICGNKLFVLNRYFDFKSQKIHFIEKKVLFNSIFYIFATMIEPKQDHKTKPMKRKSAIALIVSLMLSLFIAPQALEAQRLDELCDFGSFEETLFCAYSIYEEERFELVLDQNGAVAVSNTCDDADLTSFIILKNKEFRSYSDLSKLELGDYVTLWCEALPEEIFTALVKQENEKAAAQNNLCSSALPFCTDNGLYEFPAGVNAGIGEPGPYYACLGTRPNPAWYYMRILDPGNMDIYMYSTPQVDIDFCCWGPFDAPTEPCPMGLTRQKVVSCSYSTTWNETCRITDAQEGEYYILLITNYSNRTCNIHFSKTAGEASTDCNILPPLVSYNEPVCMGGDLHLYANGLSGSRFNWFHVGSSWTSSEQNPVRHNATTDMSGIYGCVITMEGQHSDTTYLEVTVNESIVFQRVVDTCNSFSWMGEEYTESGHYLKHLTTAAGCDSIIDLTLTLGYTPDFEISGNHWPIGGSETYISVNEYAVELDNPLAAIDTVRWSIDCENWRIVPQGRGERCTLYIFSFLEDPVMLHATVFNSCGTVSQEFSVQTSYFGVDDNTDNEWFMVTPTIGGFTVDFGALQAQVEVAVYDMQGRRVGGKSWRTDEGAQWSMEGLSAGLYLVRVVAEGKCGVRKVLINR